MTESQRKHFYFPVWSQMSARLDWRMSGGRLVADLPGQAIAAAQWPDHARSAVLKIVLRAEAEALNESRAVTAEDLRHACNLIASGGQCSSSGKFTQRHLNHFDRLCAVLRDPWNLAATIAWLNPAEDDRKRTLAYLRKLTHEARLIAIARNAWGTADWEALDQRRLDSLVAEVRHAAWPKKPKAQPANQPF